MECYKNGVGFQINGQLYPQLSCKLKILSDYVVSITTITDIAIIPLTDVRNLEKDVSGGKYADVDELITATATLFSISIDANDIATQTKQDTLISKLTDILAKISADPATQTTLAAILSKIIAAPATEAKQNTLIANQTNATQKSMVVDLDGHVANIQSVATPFAGDEYCLVTQSIIHGKTTGAGGGWVDVKVTPSGALAVENTNTNALLPTGAALEAGNLKSLYDYFNNIATITGDNTGVKGLRVYGGPTDPISDIPVYMPFDHHQLHEGEAFRWSVYVASLANNANKDIQITVPIITLGVGETYVQKCPHFRFEVIQSANGLVQLYEAPTISVQGTQRTPIALERNGTYTSKLIIKEDPTNTALGTVIWQGINTASKNGVSELVGSQNEFILKNNTTYLLRTTSLGNGNIVLIRMVWYEDLGV